jgi:type I restriction enzyme, S subunit
MSKEDELPRGWTTATIGDVVQSIKNGIYKSKEFYSDDGVACLRMYNIDGGKLVWRDLKRMHLTLEEVQGA